MKVNYLKEMADSALKFSHILAGTIATRLPNRSAK